MCAKKKLDEVLFESGYFDDIKTVQSWIMSGKITVNGKVSSKAGIIVHKPSEIYIHGLPCKYASKGGFKLEKALDVFKIIVNNKVALDAGSSTGGFTDCLLKHGSKMVYAVDAGYGQILGRLANDARVKVFEKTNVSDLTPSFFDQQPEFCSVDLSYLSLVKAIPILAKLLKPVEMVCLIKPLYEGLEQSDIHNQRLIREVLKSLFVKIHEAGYNIIDITVSPILGGNGAIEFLCYVSDRTSSSLLSANELADKAIDTLQFNPPKLLDLHKVILFVYQ